MRITHKVTENLKVTKRKSYRFVNIKFIVMLLLVAILIFIVSNRQSILEKLDDSSINSFAIAGITNFTDDNDVREVLSRISDSGELKGFFGQDIDLVKQQIEMIPWVKSVAVRKIWPNRLSIWVTEHLPIARWNETEFLSSEGIIFQLPISKLKTQGLPHLSGPDHKSAEVLEAWNKIYLDLKRKNLLLKKIAINERGSWQIVLENDVVLKLGRGEWKDKLDRFFTIYPQIEIPENKKLSYVDLRYGVGAAIGVVDSD
ncbi:cell division protein FtsQ [Histophilus somni]|uniref:Cell division protein FtsQ n=1 Tax=Histophilus somni TaxID=731 RepID=A0A9Q6Z089_HISSO|nr:cell division protein FtsQ/DivIB [Histophilus somni]ARU65408.1 cell division protein FtsQ [Histophilus somni]ARU67275.1 cell division protein FtsQ [Histophilus somni]ARU69152.1 cell division protein FtsQ [Histophilus somni]ARU71031.1 cell division protein FtsQ [Histophilus somni]ARU72902.1 cell division protein FtsQ [Histophilus somni]